MVFRAVAPLILLGGLIYAFAVRGDTLTAPIRGGASEIPPAESLTFEKIEFKPAQIVAVVRNSGSQTLEIAQIHLNDMSVKGYIAPGTKIPRLGQATVTIPHDWVEADPYEIRLVSSIGLFHAETVDAAALTPVANIRYLAVFALLGVYVGVIPLYLGLLWFPFLRRLGEGSMRFLTAFTIGLLVFLGFDAVFESFEVQHKVAEPFKPAVLIVLGIVVSFLILTTVGEWIKKSGTKKGESFVQLGVSYMIAVGIGLHNLGEGLAIGAAYSLGAVALGATLIIGFTIHNTTEGIAVVAPITRSGASLKHLVALGFIAGAPTIIGTWIGGFAASNLWSLVFLSIGAGAIFQVVYVIVKQMGEDSLKALSSITGLSGITLGLGVMYLTGLLIAK